MDTAGPSIPAPGAGEPLEQPPPPEASLPIPLPAWAPAEAEARFRHFADAVPAMLFEADPGGSWRWSADSWSRYTGLPAGALEGQGWTAVVHPADLDAARAAWEEAGRTPGLDCHHRSRLRRHDGAWRWHAVRARAERDGATGRIQRWLGSATDVHDLAAAEAALRESETRLARAAAAAGLGIWEMDVPSGATRLNPGYFALLGLPPDTPSFRVEDWIARLHPEDRDRTLAAAQAAIAAGGEFRAEFRIRRADTGEERWLAATGTVTRCAEGRPLLFAGVAHDVTDRRRAEATLAESEARLRRVQAIGRVGGFEIDLRTGHNRRSAEYMALQGHGARAAQERHEDWVRRLHPEDRARAEACFLQAVSRASGATGYAQDYRIVTPGGAVRWISARAEIERDPATGRALRMLGAHVDVTELKEAEARLRLFIERAPVSLAMFDTRMRYLAASRRFLRDFGLDEAAGPEALIGRSHAALFPGLPKRSHAVHRAVMAGEVRSSEEERFVHADGRADWIRWEMTPWRRADGTVGGALFYCEIITARVEATRALAASEARFRALVEAMPQIAFSAPADGVTDFLNARWYAFSGQAPGEGLGTGWLAATHPEDRDRTLAAWRSCVAAGETFEIEHRFRRADGAWRWLLTRAAPLRDDAGAVARWFGTCTDITEIVAAREAAARQAEELERRVAERTRALAEAAAELQAEMRRREETQAALLQAQKLEALGQLTGGVAHDFNNLLAAIGGGYRLLERRVGDDERAMELIAHGRHAAERGAKLIAGLMAFARKEDLRPAVVDPAEVLRMAEDMLCHTAGSGVRCRFEPAPGTWPVIVDPVRLETMLLNLAANARDAMPSGGTLTVAVRNAEPGEAPEELPADLGWVLISVADTGTGMDAETLRRATEPFFTTKPPGKGTGLGLASAHGFAAQSGGALRLRSEPGAGATVELFLPRAGILPHEGAGAPALHGSQPPPALDRSLHGGATLLVVDDDEGVRPVTAALLRELGYGVVEAASAEAAEALALSQGDAISMLVTDVVMGGAAGPVLARRLRAERPDLPTLYITAFPGSVELGDAPVLRKPFTEAALAHAVLRGLGRLPRGPAPPAGMAAGGPAQAADRLLGRLRHPALRRLYLRWLELDGHTALPPPEGFLGEEAAHACLLAAPQPPGAGGWRVLRAASGDGAQEDAAAALDGGGEAERLLGGSLEAACVRCAEGRRPFYDYARHAPEGGLAVLVERLLLPLSADGGASVTHVVAAALRSAVAATAAS